MKHHPVQRPALALALSLLGCVGGPGDGDLDTAVSPLGIPGALNTSLIGRYDFGADDNTRDLAVANGYAYVARRAAGFAVVDLANRAAPSLVAHVVPAAGATDVLDVATLAIAGTRYLFVANYAGAIDPTYGHFTGVYVYSLANPAAPALVSALTYGAGPGFHLASQVTTITAAEVGGRSFVFVGSAMSSGIEVFEFTNPAAPAYFTSVIRHNVSTSASIRDVRVQDGRLYAAWRVGFAVYDLSTLPTFVPDYYQPPQPPTLVAKTYVGAATLTAVPTPSGEYVLTTDDVSGGRVRVWDVRNPGAVAQVSAFGGSSAAIARHVTVQGNLAWVSHQQDGLRVFDVSNPAAPISLAWYDTDAATPSNRRVGGWDVVPDGNTAWLSDSADGIHAVNIEDTLTVQSAGWYQNARRLVVYATSSLQPRPTLTVTGFGPMTWVPTNGRYELSAPANVRPATTTVTSSYGASRSTITLRYN